MEWMGESGIHVQTSRSGFHVVGLLLAAASRFCLDFLQRSGWSMGF